MSTSPGPTPAPPAGSVPPAVPRKQGTWLWWILGIVGGLFLLFVVGSLFIAGLVVRNFRVSEKEKNVEISTPGGNVTLHATRSGKDVGLPIYPGATLMESGGGIEVTTPEGDRAGLMAVHYRTSDPAEKVDAWYRARLGPEFEREVGVAKHTSIRIQGMNVETNAIVFKSEKDDLVRLVAISNKEPGTQITLLRAGRQETQ